MAIHPTERLSNVAARLFSAAQGWTIAGTPDLIFENQERVQGDSDAFIRWTLEELPGRNNGRASAAATSDQRSVMLIADLFWPVGDTDAYAVHRAADDIEFNLTLLALQFKDYAIPAAPVDVDGVELFVTAPPDRTKLETTDGYNRRRVSAVVRWMTSHTA